MSRCRSRKRRNCVLSEASHEASAGRALCLLLDGDGLLDLHHRLLGVRSAVEPRENVLGLVVATLFAEPSGRLRGERDREKGHEREDRLDGEGNAPRDRAAVGLAEAVGHP